jgi:hypothetical protein
MYGTYLLAAALESADTPHCGNLLSALKKNVAEQHTTVDDRWHAAGGDIYAYSLACLTLTTGTPSQ